MAKLTEQQKYCQKIRMRHRREEAYKAQELAGTRPIYFKVNAKNIAIMSKMKKALRGSELGEYMSSKDNSGYQRIYYLKNYEKLKQKRNEKIKCNICGDTYRRHKKAKHRRSSIHLACIGKKVEKIESNVCSNNIMNPLLITFD